MGLKGLSKVATKPVDVGVRLVTVRPRLAMVLLVPVMLAVATSVAVIVWLPGELKVALKTPTPSVSVALPGSGRPAVAAGEMDGACVAGGGVVEGVLGRHREVDGVAGDGGGRGRHREMAGGRGADRNAALVPLRLPLAVSVAVNVWLPAVRRAAPK